jgi:hypothetical protein
MACGPWRLLASQCEAGVGLLDGMLAALGAGKPVAARAPAGAEALEQAALERVCQGLPPPREVYAAPNRDRINWAAFPDWARPSDPELFEGSAHEG